MLTNDNGRFKLVFRADLINGKLHLHNETEFKKELSLLRDGLLTVTVTNWFPKRSNEQNNLLWVWFKIIGDHIGYTPQQVKSILQLKFLHVEETLPSGETIERIKGTSELDKFEMSKFIDEIHLWASEYLSINLNKQ